jgi:hypothetical protein
MLKTTSVYSLYVLFIITSVHSWAQAAKSVIGASGLSDDDDGKNYGLKWKLAESVR